MENDYVNNYWHVYSDGKQADIPFCSDEEKVFAMNSVAIVAFQANVQVLCVNINDTHLHAVVYGENGGRFKEELRRRIIVFLKREGQGDQLGDGLFLSCDRITTRRELLSKIIYTFRNCLDFYKEMPWEYRFGVGNVYFTESVVCGKALSELSFRMQKALLRTNDKMPGEWRIDERGMLIPRYFIDIQHVDNLFVTPRAFLAFLYVRKDDEQLMKQRLHAHYLESRTMEEIRKRGNKLSNSYFGKSLLKVDLRCRLQVASKMLKEGFGSKSEGFAKALYLSLDDLKTLL